MVVMVMKIKPKGEVFFNFSLFFALGNRVVQSKIQFSLIFGVFFPWLSIFLFLTAYDIHVAFPISSDL